MANPTKLSWTGPTKNTDGSDFTADQYAGFELEINGEGAVTVPAAWSTDSRYEMPLSDLQAVQATGDYSLRMRTVAKNGNVSEWSAPAAFSMDFRVPAAPTGLQAG